MASETYKLLKLFIMKLAPDPVSTLYSETFDFTFSEFTFSLILRYKLIVSTERPYSVKISLNLCVLTSAFSAIVHSNFDDLPAETPLISRTFLFVKLLTHKCYDWSSEISQ